MPLTLKEFGFLVKDVCESSDNDTDSLMSFIHNMAHLVAEKDMEEFKHESF